MTKNNLKETEFVLQQIGALIEDCFPNTGFTLLLFPFEAPTIGSYISNVDRSDVVKVLKETVKRFENDQVIPKTQGEA